jgi:hypothetical protein
MESNAQQSGGSEMVRVGGGAGAVPEIPQVEASVDEPTLCTAGGVITPRLPRPTAAQVSATVDLTMPPPPPPMPMPSAQVTVVNQTASSASTTGSAAKKYTRRPAGKGRMSKGKRVSAEVGVIRASCELVPILERLAKLKKRSNVHGVILSGNSKSG